MVSGNLLTKLLPLTGILTFIGSSLKFHIPAREMDSSVFFPFCTGCAFMKQLPVINSMSKRYLDILICIFLFHQLESTLLHFSRECDHCLWCNDNFIRVYFRSSFKIRML